MSVIKMYAHSDPDEWEEFAQDDCDANPDADWAKIYAIHYRRPLYEVEFEFDVESGKCVAAIVEGVRMVPG